MDSELRAFIQQTRLDQQSLKHVIANLPADDAELDREIDAAIDNNQIKEFEFLILAALVAERPVDAHHLLKGITMLDQIRRLAEVALRMRGDVGKYLLEGVERAFLDRLGAAHALCVATVWCREHRDGAIPDGLIREARQIARDKKISAATVGYLMVIIINTKDRGLLELVQKQLPGMPEEAWKRFMEDAIPLTRFLIELANAPLLEGLPENDTSLNDPGTTMRRAVARVGRNEPCPCGSGRKYKNCCLDKDQERLHRSSDIAGVTREEFETTPEMYLTAARLEATPAHFLARLDPAGIPRPLVPVYLAKLAQERLYDRLVEAFEKIGYFPELFNTWREVMFMCVFRRQKSAVERLVALRGKESLNDLKEVGVRVATALLLEEDNPGRWLELIENEALPALRFEDEGDPNGLFQLAYAIGLSRFPGLGILALRSVLTMARDDDDDLSFLLSFRLSEIRDQLNLAPEDSSTAILETLQRKTATEAETAAEIAKARREAEAQRARFRDAQQAIKALHRVIKRRESVSSQKAAQPEPGAPDENGVEKELRRKIDLLMEEVKREHSEKNMYRRKYEATAKAMEQWRAQVEAAEPVQADPSADPEDDLLLPEEPQRTEPIRVIEFPRNFQQQLTGFPRHIAKAAISSLGGIAAGEPEFFAGVRRIERCPDVLRQRFGEYRLLFRLLPDRLQVLDLVPRQDLERRIKAISTTA